MGGRVLTAGAGVVKTGRALARPDLGGKMSTENSSSSLGHLVALDGGGSATSSWLWGAYHARVFDKATMATMTKKFAKIPMIWGTQIFLGQREKSLFQGG